MRKISESFDNFTTSPFSIDRIPHALLVIKVRENLWDNPKRCSGWRILGAVISSVSVYPWSSAEVITVMMPLSRNCKEWHGSPSLATSFPMAILWKPNLRCPTMSSRSFLLIPWNRGNSRILSYMLYSLFNDFSFHGWGKPYGITPVVCRIDEISHQFGIPLQYYLRFF